MVSAERPCPMPDLCDFDPDRTCRVCGKRSGVHPDTLAIQRLARRMDGGMPIARDELAAIQWDLLPQFRRGLL